MTPPALPPRFRIAIHRFRGCYIARAVDLPGCVSLGASEVEAVENARIAIRAYLRIVNVLDSERATVELEISA
jgi:predicted RNase H-like HicB family nuclease